MTVGEKIKQIRKEKGITQDELGNRLGISQSAVGQFEKENSHPRIETLRKIADALDVPVYEFSLNEGERIRSIRELKGLTQKELGEMVGLTEKQMTDIETLNYRPSNATIMKLAEALDIPYSKLVPGSIQEHSIQNDGIKITNADFGLKSIIKKLYNCEDAENEHSDIHFTKDNHTYVITDHDFNDLIPLVDGLISAYIEHKKLVQQ